MILIGLSTRRMVAAITDLVVPGNRQHFGAKVAASILSFCCRNFANGPTK